MTYEPLKKQIDITISNIEHGTIGRGDRIFLSHLLEEVRLSLPIVELEDDEEIGEEFRTVLGSTQELVEDGLEK